jgi:hypothetical protein
MNQTGQDFRNPIIRAREVLMDTTEDFFGQTQIQSIPNLSTNMARVTSLKKLKTKNMGRKGQNPANDRIYHSTLFLRSATIS